MPTLLLFTESNRIVTSLPLSSRETALILLMQAMLHILLMLLLSRAKITTIPFMHLNLSNVYFLHQSQVQSACKEMDHSAKRIKEIKSKKSKNTNYRVILIL